jgi:hypothetical protein
MSDLPSVPELQRDQQLARDLTSAVATLQKAIHAAVEVGLKVTIEVESMHHVGHHHPEPLVEVSAERVIKLG